MTKYWNKKHNFAVEAYRFDPGKTYDEFSPQFSKLFSEFPESYWLIKYDDTKMLISDELFHRFFVREPAHA